MLILLKKENCMKLENFDDIDGIVTSIMNSSTTEFEFGTSYIPLNCDIVQHLHVHSI